jgi:hypothetical protein
MSHENLIKLPNLYWVYTTGGTGFSECDRILCEEELEAISSSYRSLEETRLLPPTLNNVLALASELINGKKSRRKPTTLTPALPDSQDQIWFGILGVGVVLGLGFLAKQ